VSVIPLVEEPESEELRELYERLATGMPEFGVLNIFKIMAHNPRILRDWLRLATPLLSGGLTLSPRLREIAILRVAQVSGSEYEFAHHIRIAQQAGLSEAEISSLKDHDETDLFYDLDRAVIRYTDALANLTAEGPDLARGLKRWLSDLEILELSFCVGHWHARTRTGAARGAGGRCAGGDASRWLARMALTTLETWYNHSAMGG